MIKHILCAALAATLLTGCATLHAGVAAQQDQPVRVILINGDGVGLGAWSALRMVSDTPLALDRLPHIGLMDTRCVCDRTTDSGAAATAFATGYRTRYRMIGMGPDSTPHTSVLEAAEARGLSTGLVTTVHVTDATPAAFGAHSPTRYDRQGIAAQYAQKDIEVLLGGGLAYFSKRADGRDLVRELSGQYTVVTTPAQFAAVDAARTERLLGLFADSTIFPDKQLRPSLPDMARKALAILDRNPRGFFVLLENEDTDDVLEHNDSLPAVYAAMRELDATVAVALDYQQRHPETLIVLLGDHESGGLTLQVRPRGQLAATYSIASHTATAVPIFAGGPGAERFGRWLDNEQVGRLLLEYVRGR